MSNKGICHMTYQNVLLLQERSRYERKIPSLKSWGFLLLENDKLGIFKVSNEKLGEILPSLSFMY